MADTPTPSTDPANPFADTAITPSPEPPEPALDVSDVLTVDRNATLTLGTDALIVLDEGLRHRRAASNCCGLLPASLAKTTQAIPFHNILWADLTTFDLTIHYAQQEKARAAVRYIHYALADKTHDAHPPRLWLDRLLARAYPPQTTRRPRIKVLINPFGGQGYAQKLWQREIEPLFAAARCEVDVEKTAYRGHAAEIAAHLDIEAYDVVACASGDGTPHEVFNGLARRPDAGRALRKIAVVNLPCGSGNAMSLNFNGTDSASLAALEVVKGVRTRLDLVAITQGRERYFSFLSQAVGIIAETDLGTESLRWMGPMRFTWGVLVRLLGKEEYPAEIAVAVESDDKNAIKEAYRNAVREQEASAAKHVTLDEDEDGNEGDSSSTFPRLRYGTVQDPLPSSFIREDHPTLGNFYVGNLCWMTADAPFFPTALPADGRMDMITISATIPRLTGLRMLATSGDGSLMNFPEVAYRKVAAYRITPRRQPPQERGGLRKRLGRWLGGSGERREGLIAVDGEKVPFEPFQAEVLRGVATVLSKRRGLFEWEGLREG